MQESERKKLFETKEEYLNFGVTAGGVPRWSIPVPWEATAHAYNMRTPNVYLSPEDLKDPEILARMKQFRTLGFYIFTPLDDYAFLAEFTGLWDLYIQCGENVKDLSFLSGLSELFMFYLEDATIPDLKGLFGGNRTGRLHSFCLGLCNCKVDDFSSYIAEGPKLSELVVFQPKGSDERLKWKAIPAMRYYYYEFKTE